jgi:molybdate transport system ATP-binding protein
LLDLGHLLERRPNRLSGGEKQRVAIGRALLASPRLLLMDEPLASLDAPRKSEILYYVERMRDELRIPIVYVSHAIDEIMRLADIVVELADGRVTAIGPVHETIGRHGGGAVIDAHVAEQDLASGLARLTFAGGELYSPDLDALPGERVRVRIASRDVAIALSRPSDSSFLNVLACTVGAVGSSDGASIDVQLDAGGAPLIARITRKSAAALGIAPGRSVFALIKAVAVDRQSVGYA